MKTYKYCPTTGHRVEVDTVEQKIKDLRYEINILISLINANYFDLKNNPETTGEEYTSNNLYLTGKLCKKQLKLSEIDPTYQEYGKYTNLEYDEDFDPRDV